jgi:effector-binding domain-containing protein
LPDVGVTSAPLERLDASWKQRLPQPYVFVEETAPRADFGRLIERAFDLAAAQGVDASGAPFGLFELAAGGAGAIRMRACIPVDDVPEVEAPLGVGALEGETVAYAYVAGAYSEVVRAYAPLVDWMSAFDWVPAGFAREVYLVDPALVGDQREMVTELQIPVAPRR